MVEQAQQFLGPQVQEVQVSQVQQPAPVAEENGKLPAPPGAYFYLYSRSRGFFIRYRDSNSLSSFVPGFVLFVVPEKRLFTGIWCFPGFVERFVSYSGVNC